MTLVWHASGTGARDDVLRSLLNEGARKHYCRADKNMQAQGIFFTSSKPWAVAYAERLQHPNHVYRRDGKPFVAAATFVPSDDWDLDYELELLPALAFLKRFDLEKFPAEKLRVTVRKKNLPMIYDDPPRKERDDVVADWALTSITMLESGPELQFRNLLEAGKNPKIAIGWDGAVMGAQAQSGSFASVLEQLVHHYRDLDRAAFRDYIAINIRAGLALKYTGEAPLPIVTAEVKDDDGVWKQVKA